MTKTIDTVKRLYEAFGRGEVPTILEFMHPDVDWEYGHPPVAVPWLAPRRGRDAVAGFFEALASGLEFKHFAVRDVLGSSDGRTVVALVDVELLVKSTGRTIHELDEAHVWRFDEHGKVVRFRHGVDTAQHLAALA